MNAEIPTPMTPEEDFMAFVATLPEPQWRILRKGEKFQSGDQYFCLHPDCICWDSIPSAWEGDDCSGDGLERRQMTPAEMNAEELLAMLERVSLYASRLPGNLPDRMFELIFKVRKDTRQ